MAYSCLVGKSEANQAAVLADIYAQLEAMGWTKVDDQPASGSCAPADVSVAGNTITIVGHAFVNGQHIMYSTTGTVIGGLTALSLYFIVNVSGDTFKLSLTQGGGAIDLTSQGTGVHSFTEGYRVYSTTGEAADKPVGYICIDHRSATIIRLSNYCYWNATTHAGLGAGLAIAAPQNALTTSESGCYLWAYGNLEMAVFLTKVSTTYQLCCFGYLKKLWSMETTTTEAASSGLNVQISVVDNSQFIAGKKYQIYGLASEGRDQVTVNALPAGKVQIANLPRNYGSGSIIGEQPSTFGMYTGVGTVWLPVAPLNVAGTATASINASVAGPLTGANVSPDNRAEQKYVIEPWFAFAPTTAGYNAAEGYLDSILMLIGSSTGLTTEDLFGAGQSDSGTSSGSNDSTHFNDTAKAWGVDALADKFLLITAGVGVGQTRKIASNGATQIIPVTAFTTVPDGTSTYVIADEAWRLFICTLGWVVQEII